MSAIVVIVVTFPEVVSAGFVVVAVVPADALAEEPAVVVASDAVPEVAPSCVVAEVVVLAAVVVDCAALGLSGVELSDGSLPPCPQPTAIMGMSNRKQRSSVICFIV